MNNYQTIIAVDPGMSGAACAMSLASGAIQIFDAPTKIVGKGKSKKTIFDKERMAAILRPYAGRSTVACIEGVHAMPGQGVSSSFNFGRGLGIWEGIFAAFD